MKNFNKTVTSTLSLMVAAALLAVSLTGGMAAPSACADEYDLRMDLNSDGCIDMLDALLLYKVTSGECTLSSSGGDLNGDGLVNMIDSHYLYTVVSSGALATTQPTTTAAAATTTTTAAPSVEITDFEQRMFDLINDERIKEGVAPLRFAYEDYACAKLRAREQELCEGHTRPDGSRAKTVYTTLGMEIPAYFGENLALYQRSPEAAMEGLMNSPGHRNNILNENYTAVAIGVEFDKFGYPMYAQLFKR